MSEIQIEFNPSEQIHRIVCPECIGRKTHKGMGGMDTKCELCDGLGKIRIYPEVETAEVEKPIIKPAVKRVLRRKPIVKSLGAK